MITHVLAFRYRPNTTQEQRAEVLNRFLALKHECKRAGQTGPPFESDFDAAHDDFNKFAIPLLSVDEQGNTNGAMVFDFDTPAF